MNPSVHARATSLAPRLRFAHVVIVGKYQAPGSRAAVDEVAHFLHDEGCDVSLERETALFFYFFFCPK